MLYIIERTLPPGGTLSSGNTFVDPLVNDLAFRAVTPWLAHSLAPHVAL